MARIGEPGRLDNREPRHTPAASAGSDDAYGPNRTGLLHGKHPASCKTSTSSQPWRVLPYGRPALRVHGAPLGACPVGSASKYVGQVVWILKVCHCDSPEFGGMRPLKVKVSSTLVAVTSWESATKPVMPS